MIIVCQEYYRKSFPNREPNSGWHSFYFVDNLHQIFLALICIGSAGKERLYLLPFQFLFQFLVGYGRISSLYGLFNAYGYAAKQLLFQVLVS